VVAPGLADVTFDDIYPDLDSSATGSYLVSGQSQAVLGDNITTAFGTIGVGLVENAFTQTDSTTGAGTVATAYGSVFGAVTLATSSNAITITNAYGLYLKDPVAGAHVTLTNKYALGVDSLRCAGALTYGGVTLNNAVTGTGNMVLSASPTFTGTLTAATVSAANGSTTGNFDIGSNATVTGIAAVHTTLGGWDGNGIVAALSANNGASAFIADVGGSTGYCFNGRMNTVGGNFAGWNYNGSYVGSITSNGTSTSYNTSSDARLKTNIRDAADTGAIIDALRVRSWEWTTNGATEAFGFVAQEEALAYPPAVRIGDDNPDEIVQQWGRDDSKLVPLLVKEIQSLRARVAALEA
jgi:hypothetical protein